MADISKLFQQGGASIGLTPQASDTIINNLSATTAPIYVGGALTMDEEETDDFRLLFFCVDGSSSMQDVEAILVEVVNDVLLPGLLGGARDQVGAIRYGGLVFNNSVRPLWGGQWLPLDDKFPRLSAADYKASGMTALNKAVLDGVSNLTKYALELKQLTGTTPQCTLVVLSDGANNLDPTNPSDIRQILDSLSPELFTLHFLGFETAERVDFRAIASELGFRDIDHEKAKAGETLDERRRRFRNWLGVYSSRLNAAVSKSKVGTTPGSSSTSGTKPGGVWS